MPEAGWYLHYITLYGEPVDWWGVIQRVDRDTMWVDLLGYQGRNKCTLASTELSRMFGHCTAFPEPPDEFFVWQAKQALLEGVS